MEISALCTQYVSSALHFELPCVALYRDSISFQEMSDIHEQARGIICGRKRHSNGLWDPTEPVHSRKGAQNTVRAVLWGVSALGMAASHPSGDRQVGAPELLSWGKASLSLTEIPPLLSFTSTAFICIRKEVCLCLALQSWPFLLCPILGTSVSASSPASLSSTAPCLPCSEILLPDEVLFFFFLSSALSLPVPPLSRGLSLTGKKHFCICCSSSSSLTYFLNPLLSGFASSSPQKGL